MLRKNERIRLQRTVALTAICALVLMMLLAFVHAIGIHAQIVELVVPAELFLGTLALALSLYCLCFWLIDNWQHKVVLCCRAPDIQPEPRHIFFLRALLVLLPPPRFLA